LVGDRFMSATKPCAALLGISQVFTGMTPKRANPPEDTPKVDSYRAAKSGKSDFF
jgi:hypothetical protein